ncbi:hypothetical protein [Roseimicrobium sp. ORNL1]|uniref:hypothetical protein n=1 Tax=Roseimicrobium sp. ORNL1 TaxID=2711231 RepID=UPI0013E10CA2|nr:hypothetical protein [Roseimicrobium sp. ORNL1]QIF05463.1 hypothetical protein G5S37_29515 [Roseimicrobium sp. ORNL1]
MKLISRRNARQGGFVPLATIYLMVFLFVYSIYLGILLPVANRLKPPDSPGWWAIVLGPFAVCLLVVSPYSMWCWLKGKDVSTLGNATLLVFALEVLFFLFAVGATIWRKLT